jgi:putative FmdB family regulatory protein
MPIFEYKCRKCGNNFELLEKASDKSKRICPSCGCEDVEKQISVFSAVVKEGESKKCHSCSDFKCPHSGH